MADYRDYHALYHTQRWRKLRRATLDAEPFCRMCLASGIVTSATVADHIVPHRGDEELFWQGERQGLCKVCHDTGKARIERIGFDSACDLDGYPTDLYHPANK